MPATYELARKIAAGPPIAIRLAKRALYHSLDVDLRARARVRDLRAEHRLGDGRRARGHPRLRREAAGGVQGTLTAPSPRVFWTRTVAVRSRYGHRGRARARRRLRRHGNSGRYRRAGRAVRARRRHPVRAQLPESRNRPGPHRGRARRLGPDVLVMVDHEGGGYIACPLRSRGFRRPATVGRSGDPRLAAAVASAMARELRAAGFDSGLAPVLDCLVESASTVIGDRAFGAAPDAVAACGVASVRAMLAEGSCPWPSIFRGTGAPPSIRITSCRTSTRTWPTSSTVSSCRSGRRSAPGARRC